MVVPESLPQDVILSSIGAIIAALLSVIVFFLIRFVKRNDYSWDRVAITMNELANTVNLLAHRTNENEEDIKELRAEVRGLPAIKHKR